jgi:DNA-binding transcriptional LysR family regulator
MKALASAAASAEAGALRGSYCTGAADLVAVLITEVGRHHPELDLVFETRLSAEVLESVLTGRDDIGIARTTHPALKSILLTSHLIDRATNAHVHALLTQFFESSGVQPRSKVVPIGTIDELFDLVATRHGLTMITRFELERNPHRGVVARPLVGRVPVTEHHLVWRGSHDRGSVTRVVQVAAQLTSQFRTL